MADQPETMNTTPGTGEFSNGLMDCCSQGCCNYCGACWCPCFIYGETESKRKNDNDKTMHTFIHFLVSCIGFGPCMTGLQRRDIRETNQIGGNLCCDVFLSCCCSPCVLVQSNVEVKK